MAAIIAMALSHLGFTHFDKLRRTSDDDAHAIADALHGTRTSVIVDGLNLHQYLASGLTRDRDKVRHNSEQYARHAKRLEHLAQFAEIADLRTGIDAHFAEVESLNRLIIQSTCIK